MWCENETNNKLLIVICFLVDGSWGAWEGWSVCYCNGFRPRYRKCDSPPPLNGGHVCNGSEFEVGMCNRTSNTNCPGMYCNIFVYDE